jgi:Putative adhesin
MTIKPIKLFTSTAAVLTLAAATAFAADASFDRTLNVSGAPNVSVSTGSGTVHLHPGSANQVHVVAHLHSSHGWMSGGSSDVDSRIQQIVNNPPIVQSGNDITIGERHNNDLYRNISIDYDITLPASSTIAAATGSGDVEIQNVGATLKAQTGSGNVNATGIQGPATLGTGSGDITLHQTGPGDVKAETGSGNIHLQGLSGALKASTGSGDIEAAGQPTSDWKLSTGSGSVRLIVGNARFNFDAETGSGSINVSQPITMQGSLNRHHVSGAVNGGGPTIKVGTGSGDIQVK